MTGNIMNRGKSQCHYRYFPGSVYLHDGVYVVVHDWDTEGVSGIDRDTVLSEMQARSDGFIQADPLPPTSQSLSCRRLLRVSSRVFPQVFVCSVCMRVVHSLDNPDNLINELRLAEAECSREGHRFYPRQFRFVSIDPCGFIGEGYDPRVARCPGHRNASMCLRTGQSERVSNFRWVCTVPGCGTELRVTGISHNCTSNRVIQHKAMLDPPKGPRSTDIVLVSKNIVSLPEIFTRVNLQDPRRLDIKGYSNWQGRVFAFLTERDTHVSPDLCLDIRRMAQNPENLLIEAIEGIARRDPAKADAIRRGLPLELQSEISEEIQITDRTANEVLDYLLAVNQPPEGMSRSLVAERSDLVSTLREIGMNDVILLENINLTTVLYGYSRGDYDAGARQLKLYCEDSGRGRSSRQNWKVYCSPVNTEGVIVVMDPVSILQYINTEASDGGFRCSDPLNRRACAEAIARSYRHSERRPLFGFGEGDSSSALLYRTIHTVSHLLIRCLGRTSGVEESSIAEILFPSCCSFLLYVNQSGDFNMGTFSTCFENYIEEILGEMRDRAEDCLYDPVCVQDSNGACPACLLIGEVSCENFNRDLSRKYLVGDGSVRGYWQRRG